MTAARLDLVDERAIEQSATYHLGYQRRLADGVTPHPVPVDARLRMQIRATPDAPDPALIDITHAPGADGQILIGDAVIDGVTHANARLAITLTASATGRLTMIKAWYDLFLDTPGATSEVDKLLRGSVSVISAVTRPAHD